MTDVNIQPTDRIEQIETTMHEPDIDFMNISVRALRPVIQDQHHQDSLFGNSFQSKSFFVVHPEWLSEAVDNTNPQPLHRPPWPWEQPRYRQNVQVPITYKMSGPEGGVGPTEDQVNVLLESELRSETPCSRAKPIGYTFTQPLMEDTKPFDKQTAFGAPVVDTTRYNSS